MIFNWTVGFSEVMQETKITITADTKTINENIFYWPVRLSHVVREMWPTITTILYIFPCLTDVLDPHTSLNKRKIIKQSKICNKKYSN